MESTAARVLIGLAGLVGGALLTVWFVWHTVKQADDPGRVLYKWIITGVIFIILLGLGAMISGSGRGGAFLIPAGAAAFGVVLGILWAPHLGAVLAKPLTSFYDGGAQEIEVRPFYAIARAKQKRGHYAEAIGEIRKQLERFPEDYEGWMLQAEIFATDLKDHASAQECIQELLRHKSHTPRNIAFALNRSADWHLSLASDREAARLSLEEIVARFPGSELAHIAEQRIAHLTTDQMLAEQRERPRLVVTRHEEYIGLRGEVADPRPPAEDPEAAARRLIAHLVEHPHDAEVREELARLYADSFQRLDLAIDQIDQLVATPGAAQKEVARWLNILADFQVSLAQDKVAARSALDRIIQLYPGTAVAAKAETRIAYLETEMRKNKKSQAIKLGSAEENLGLKSSRPFGRP
jgi:tetratricopeptide (TPR) repeat protein